MAVLILGVVIFLGVHSIRLVAEGWRTAQLARFGERGWKGLYSVVSLVGFVLIVWGYGVARRNPAVLWVPPVGARHLTALFVAVAFILIAATHVPGTRIKRIVGHPMYAGVAAWAIGHLLANGTAHAMLLFGTFFVWSGCGYVIWRARDRAARVRVRAGSRPGVVKSDAAGCC